jgi:hypothetical protein
MVLALLILLESFNIPHGIYLQPYIMFHHLIIITPALKNIKIFLPITFIAAILLFITSCSTSNLSVATVKVKQKQQAESNYNEPPPANIEDNNFYRLKPEMKEGISFLTKKENVTGAIDKVQKLNCRATKNRRLKNNAVRVIPAGKLNAGHHNNNEVRLVTLKTSKVHGASSPPNAIMVLFTMAIIIAAIIILFMAIPVTLVSVSVTVLAVIFFLFLLTNATVVAVIIAAILLAFILLYLLILLLIAAINSDAED